MKYILTACLLLFSLSCSHDKKFSFYEYSDFDKATNWEAVPLVRLSDLTADTAKSRPTIIRVEGYYYYGFEESGLYPSKGKDSGRPIWIDFPKDFNPGLEPGFEKLKGKKVIVAGLFGKAREGYLGLYRGTLTAVYIAEK